MKFVTMKAGMKKIFLTILVTAFIIFLFLSAIKFLNKPQQQINTVDYSKSYPSTDAGLADFEKKKTGAYFTIYFHPIDEALANKTLNVLEQTGAPLYQKYLSVTPQNIVVYITDTADEYVKTANFPGGKQQLQIGDGSAPAGKIYLYKPFQETFPGKTEGVIIHEGAHAVLYQFLGKENMSYLPGFLNEGIAHFLEYVFKAGSNFRPLDEIYHSDLLINGIKIGKPPLLDLDELGRKCEGYINEETLNFLCRSQGTFTVWFISKNYGEDFLGKFLVNLKQTQNWQQSLQKLTGKGISQLGQEVQDQLRLMVR